MKLFAAFLIISIVAIVSVLILVLWWVVKNMGPLATAAIVIIALPLAWLWTKRAHEQSLGFDLKLKDLL